jgi:hypothetical protein
MTKVARYIIVLDRMDDDEIAKTPKIKALTNEREAAWEKLKQQGGRGIDLAERIDEIDSELSKLRSTTTDDYAWPESDEAGMEQVAAELQEAMEVAGEPAGFFRVVARTEIDYDGVLAYEIPAEDAHRAALLALMDTRTY